MLQRQVDGLLIVPAGAGAETVRLCRDRGVPLVVVDRRPATPGVDGVRADSEGGALQLGGLIAFIGMRQQGLNANIMSLGGIAIAVGAMVDAARRPKVKQLDACGSVGKTHDANIFMRAGSLLVPCSQTTRRPSRSRAMPLAVFASARTTEIDRSASSSRLIAT